MDKEINILNQNGLCPCLYILKKNGYQLILYECFQPRLLKHLFKGTLDECKNHAKNYQYPLLKNIFSTEF